MQPDDSTPSPSPLKYCPRCQATKPRTAFYRGPLLDGLRSYCKGCENECNNTYHRQHHAEEVAHALEWRRNHREQARAADKIKRQRHPDKIQVKNAKFRAEHPDYQKQWRKAHPEYRAHCRRIYRARKKGANGSHKKADVLALLAKQSDQCFWCHVRLNGKYHVDHVIPLSKGGSNNVENLVIACPYCNDAKGKSLPDDWRADKRLADRGRWVREQETPEARPLHHQQLPLF